MSERTKSRKATMNEAESIRQQKPQLGVEDLGNLEELGGSIVDAVDHHLFERELDADIHAVYVCGSFAEGTATETFSDLDVRVVIDRIPEMDREEIESDLRVYDGPHLVPDVCGYFDPHVAPAAPSSYHTSVLIWGGDDS